MAERTFVLRLEIENGQAVIKGLDDIGDKGDRAGRKVKEAFDGEASPGMRAFTAAVDETGRKVDDFAGRLGPLGSILRAIGPTGLAVAAAIGAIGAATVAMAGYVREAISEMDALQDVADRLKVNVETIQGLRLSAREAGFEFADADAALQSIRDLRQKALSGIAGSERAGNLFAALGIGNDELRTLETTEALINRVSRALGQMGDQGQAMALLTRAGLDALASGLIESGGNVDQLTSRFRDSGQVLNEQLVQSAAELTGEWETMATRLDTQVAPALEKLGRLATSLLSTVVAFVERIGQGGSEATEMANVIATARERVRVAGLSEEVSVLERNLELLAQGGIDTATDAAARRIQERISQIRVELGPLVEADTFAGGAAPRGHVPIDGPLKVSEPEIDWWSIDYDMREAERARTRAASDADAAGREAAASARRDEAQALRDVVTATALVLDVQGKEAQAKAALTKTVEGLNKARELGVIATDAERDALILKAQQEALEASPAVQAVRKFGSFGEGGSEAGRLHDIADGLGAIREQSEAAKAGLGLLGDAVRGRIQDFEDFGMAILNTLANLIEMAGMASLRGEGDFLGNLLGMFGIGGGGATTGARGAANSAGAAFLGRRAGGGDVVPGGFYLVGERGPELASFAQPGFVHDSTATAAHFGRLAAAGRSGGGGPMLVVKQQTINNASDVVETRQRERTESDGTRVLDTIIDKKVKATVKSGTLNGDFDQAQANRYGAAPKRVRRGG